MPAKSPSVIARTFYEPRNTCGHTNRKFYGKGMCANCYDHSRWRPSGDPDNEGSDLLNIRPRYHCGLCGDGYNELRRKCMIYYNICDVCHAEYCECDTVVEVTPLEDIMQMSGEEQIAHLRIRKVTLRAAGKKTNSLPVIEIDSPLDEERVGVTEVKYHVIRPWSYE